jgi:hypothetical protein
VAGDRLAGQAGEEDRQEEDREAVLAHEPHRLAPSSAAGR